MLTASCDCRRCVRSKAKLFPCNDPGKGILSAMFSKHASSDHVVTPMLSRSPI